MRPKPIFTFIGPVQWEGKWQAEKPAHFLLLQSSGATIKLEYISRLTAAGARQDLLANPHTYPVASMRLLQGIQEALKANLPVEDHDSVADKETTMEEQHG